MAPGEDSVYLILTEVNELIELSVVNEPTINFLQTSRKSIFVFSIIKPANSIPGIKIALEKSI